MTYDEKIKKDTDDARREREQDDRLEREAEAAAFQRERMRAEIDEGRAEQRQAERDVWAYC